MEQDLYLVVGDAFREFTEHAGVSAVSDTLALLKQRSPDMRGRALLVGQGISRQTRAELEHAARDAGASVYPATGTAPVALTHKSTPDGVLISTPERLGPGRYRSDLITGSEADRLADHITGQHLGGMVLVEAARQLGVASLELEYAADDAPMSYGLAWGGLVVRFLSYAFPTPTDLRVTLEQDQAKSRRNQLSINLTFQVTQAGQIVAEMVMETALIEKSTLKKLEARRAAQIVDKICGEPACDSPIGAVLAVAEPGA